MNGKREREWERERVDGNLRCAASRSNNLNRRFFRASSALPRDQKSMTFQDTRVVLSLRSFMLSFFSTFMELGHVERSFLFHGVSFIFQQACFSPSSENDKLLGSPYNSHIPWLRSLCAA